jgi:hypothetical protein
MAVLSRRRFAGAVLAFASLGFAQPARAQAPTFSGTIASAQAGSIAVRSSAGVTAYAVAGAAGAVIGAALKMTAAPPISISGSLEKPGSVATFATSPMTLSADVSGRIATVAPGVTVALDWGLTKHVSGKGISLTGRLAKTASGLTFTVGAASGGIAAP